MLKGARVLVAGAEQGAAVGGENAAPHQAPLPGELFEALRTEQIGVGERFREVNAARPVLRAGKDAGLDHEHGQPGIGQPDRRARARGAGADYDYVVLVVAHASMLSKWRARAR